MSSSLELTDLSKSSPSPPLPPPMTRNGHGKKDKVDIKDTETPNSSVKSEWKLSRDDLKYNLMIVKIMIWSGWQSTDFDVKTGRMWLPHDESRFRSKKRMRNIWIASAGIRLLSVILSIFGTLLSGQTDSDSHQLILDLMVIFVFSQLFYGYFLLAVYDLPSQAILSNQMMEYLPMIQGKMIDF